MADEDLTVKASIDDELSGPLDEIRDKVKSVGREASGSGRTASLASRGWATFGRAAHRAGRLAKGALLGIAAGTTAAAVAFGRLAMSSIRQASDLNESLNAVNVTYGKQAKAVKKLGREAAKSLGLSNVEFNGMAVQFASFAQAIGGEGKGSVKVLDQITRRAADFASVMNLEVSEATALFQSGLAGESEPLRKYGINLSAAAVKAYALSKGIIKGTEDLNDAQKVTATYGLLMESTAKTQGDFANTSDQLANQQRILGARFDNAQAKLGRGLLPLMQTGVKWLNREGIPAFLRFSDWFNDEGIPKMQAFIEKGRTLYAKHLPKIKSVLGDVRDVAEVAAEAGKDLVGAFVGMPSWARKLLVGGAVGGVAAKKLGVFGLLKGLGKGAGGLAALATKAKPLPVFVVNNGIPGTDGPGGKPRKPTGKLPPALATLGFAAAAGVGTDVTRRVLTDAIGAERASAIQMSVATPGGTGIGAGALDVMDLDETAASRRKKKAAEQAAQLEKIARAADVARMKAAGFGAELDLVGARKVTPELKADSITKANDYLARFIGMQIDAGRPVTTYLTINGYAQAMQQISTLTTAIHSIPSAGVDNGVSYVGGGPRPGPASSPSKPPKTTPNVADRAPAGRVAGGNVTVAPGAIQVNNPASDIDLERAITNGVRNYVREREERR